MPGFPGCLEDAEFPHTALRSALFQDPMTAAKWAEQPDTRQLPADLALSYHAHTGPDTEYSREHWDNYDGFLCPSKVSSA